MWLLNPYYDALAIYLNITNHLIKHILIDNDNSAKTLFSKIVNAIGIP